MLRITQPEAAVQMLLCVAFEPDDPSALAVSVTVTVGLAVTVTVGPGVASFCP